MTLIEVGADYVYASTDSKDEFVRLIAFLQKNVSRMDARDQKAITIYEAFEIPPPPMAKEPA